MRYVSTRGTKKVSLSSAIATGLAEDGGLFVPEHFPLFTPSSFEGAETYLEIGKIFLKPFLEGDPLEEFLDDILSYTFSFDIPLQKLDETTSVLELFHGPTGAFKDVGARFLARCFEHLEEEKTILVATSGDTGSAVASAFYGLENTSAVILFPKGKISEFQERQLTCWNSNILSLRVRGDFDNCQKIVKEIFSDPSLKTYNFSSANSINIGRLLPQCLYYVASSLMYYRANGKKPSFVIPSGNMGNALACIYARHMGLPIGNIYLGCNSNTTIPEYFRDGVYRPRPSVRTLANAMDVGAPSNMERFLSLQSQITNIYARSFSDEEILAGIQDAEQKHGITLCPHTSVAYIYRQSIPDDSAVIVATAHPSKFQDVVKQAIGRDVALAPQLQPFLEKDIQFTEVGASKDEVVNEIINFLSKS